MCSPNVATRVHRMSECGGPWGPNRHSLPPCLLGWEMAVGTVPLPAEGTETTELQNVMTHRHGDARGHSGGGRWVPTGRDTDSGPGFAKPEVDGCAQRARN